MKEYKYYWENGIELVNDPPPNFDFIGGKADDITVTVAQVFADKGADDPRRHLSEDDKYFPYQKTLYTGLVPTNKKDGFYRAKFHKHGENKVQSSSSSDDS